VTTFATAMSAVLGGIVKNSLLAEERREITHELTRQVLMTDTSARIVQAHLKAQAFRAQSEAHASMYDTAYASLQSRLDEIKARRSPVVAINNSPLGS
jgi:hypothetical protein